MGKDELTDEPLNRVEKAIDEGMTAMADACEEQGLTFKRAFIVLRCEELDGDEPDAGANARGDYEGNGDVLLDLLTQARVLAAAQGVDLHLLPLDKPIGSDS
jgi:hypothetical protein